jgi:HEAT repeat protein
MGSVVDEKILFDLLSNKNEDEELRNNAIIALNSIGDGDIAKNLVPYLNDESPMIKETVITTLGSFAYPFATKQLLDILATEKEYGIQKETIHALGQITDKARIILPKIIERWYIEKDETLRQELRDAIENLYLKEDVESTYKNEAIKILAK